MNPARGVPVVLGPPGPEPEDRGRFGEFGGRFVPETLIPALMELELVEPSLGWRQITGDERRRQGGAVELRRQRLAADAGQAQLGMGVGDAPKGVVQAQGVDGVRAECHGARDDERGQGRGSNTHGDCSDGSG